MVTDYVLEPDSDVLQIRLRLINKIHKAQEPLVIVGVASGDGAELYAQGHGFDPQSFSKLTHVGMIGRHLGYALVSGDKPLTPLVNYTGVWVLTGDTLKLPAAGEVQTRLYLAVTAGEPEAVRRAVRALQKKTGTSKVSGTVTGPSKAAVAGARVHVQKDDSSGTYVTMTRTGATGGYALELEPGDYKLTVTADGRAPSSAAKVKVASAALSRSFSVGGDGTVEYTVTDENGGALPSKLVFSPQTAAAKLPAWMSVDTLKVVMGGTQVHKVTLDSSTADPKKPATRYDSSLELLPARDTWVVVMVSGKTSLAPVSTGTPFAVTNPIYLDVDGNKAYDSPKAF